MRGSKAQLKPTQKAAVADEVPDKERIVPEKAIEKARVTKLKVTQKEHPGSENPEEAVAKENLEKMVEKRVEKAKIEKAKAPKVNGENITNILNKKASVQSVRDEFPPMSASKAPTPKVVPRNGNAKVVPVTEAAKADTEVVPILSKMPKKNKPIVAKAIRIPREEESEGSTGAHVLNTPVSDVVTLPNGQYTNVAEVFQSDLVDADDTASRDDDVEPGPTPLDVLLEQIDAANPGMNIMTHPFFDMTRLNPSVFRR